MGSANSWPPRWEPGPHWKPAKTGPKPKRRIRVKPRSREERTTVETVRAACVTRDGRCRGTFEGFPHDCRGPSEWAHLHRKRRSKTRGLAPTVRHTTLDSLMLCRTLHQLYDAHKVGIECGGHGCNGPLRFA